MQRLALPNKAAVSRVSEDWKNGRYGVAMVSTESLAASRPYRVVPRGSEAVRQRKNSRETTSAIWRRNGVPAAASTNSARRMASRRGSRERSRPRASRSTTSRPATASSRSKRCAANAALEKSRSSQLSVPSRKAINETPRGASLIAFLDGTDNWELRDFSSAALAAQRFDGLLAVAGREVVDRLARGLDRSRAPLREAIRLAEFVDAAAGTVFLRQMADVVSREFLRCRAAADPRGTTLYGLLAARLSVDSIAAPYLPFFQSSETLDTAALFGNANLCIQRHFFYDDDDGVRSFESFRKTYQRDPAWEIEDRGAYVRLTGRGADGRRIEIFANVPIDCHLRSEEHTS